MRARWRRRRSHSMRRLFDDYDGTFADPWDDGTTLDDDANLQTLLIGCPPWSWSQTSGEGNGSTGH